MATDTPTVATLETRVTRLATQASVTPPSVAVVDSPVPNCYTIGRHGNATIVVSTALLETLDEPELDAVLAHELAHVLNRDVTVMTMAVAPFRLARSLLLLLSFRLVAVSLVVCLLLVFRWLSTVYDWIVTAASLVEPGPIVEIALASGAKDGFTTFIDGLSSVVAALLTGGLFVLPVVLALSIYYAVLGVIPRQLSIYREYAADRGAALVTGNPAAMASALETLSNATDRPTDDLRRATDIQALCLIPDGITDEVEVGPIREWIADDWPIIDALLQWTPTGIVAHPPIDDRIVRLRDMHRTLEDQ